MLYLVLANALNAQQLKGEMYACNSDNGYLHTAYVMPCWSE